MLIGHLPAAYILGRVTLKYFSVNQSSARYLILLLLVGGIFPDIDLLYFYTVGAKKVVHHEYWSHIPFFWASIYLIFSAFLLAFRKTRVFCFWSVFFLGIALHLVLDTLAGQIQWLYPLSTQGYTLVKVPSIHDWWVLNFLTHWTFLIEIMVVVLAAVFVPNQRSLKREC